MSRDAPAAAASTDGGDPLSAWEAASGTRLVLVRHAESNTTVARVIGGARSCTGLSALGHRQAQRLRDRLAHTGELRADVVMSSAHRRARETAEVVLPGLRAHTGEVKLLEEAGFGEQDPGPDCDGLTFQAFVERYGSPDWESDPYLHGFPGGETLAEFHLRVHVTLSRVLAAHAGATVVVFCHGGVIDAIVRRALNGAPVGTFELYTGNASLTEMELRRPGRWRLHRYNDIAHLEGLPRATEPAL